MPAWGLTDDANNKPTWSLDANVVYGVDIAEVGVNPKVAHAGWVQVEYGKGPVISITVANGGTGYTNATAVGFTGAADVNAAATITTNSTGGITSATLSDGGTGYIAAPDLAVAGGTGGVLTAVMGGRVGRIRYETLVATKGITGDAEDTLFPDS